MQQTLLVFVLPLWDTLSFYSKLKQLITRFPKEDKIILLGDLAARVGRDFDVWRCLSSHRIVNFNNNGLQLLQLCNELNLVIGNTWFQQKVKYKGIWQHLWSKHWHLIDYVIVYKHDLQDHQGYGRCKIVGLTIIMSRQKLLWEFILK